MTKIELQITATPGSYRILATAGAWQSQPRELRRGSSFGYPLPPETESASWQGLSHAALCDGPDDRAIARLHRLVLLSDPTEEDQKCFSAWLFASLLGPLWDEIEKQFPTGGLHLDVACQGDVARIEGLPWEMMALKDRPMIAAASRAISISRLVDRHQAPADVALELPLRVLFVVAEMDDALRPGAEYLSMLHTLDAVVGGQVSSLIVRPLIDATTDGIRAAMTAFRPQIIHIVAHGGRDAGGPFIRLLKKADDNQRLVPDPCDPQRLLDLLTGMDREVSRPVLCLINACHSADEGEPGDPRSFAAELVKGGVVAAVGMAGEVASNACRLFTKAMYRGLLAKRSIAQAVADGQFTSRLYYAQYGRSVEWARPALFMARDTQVQFTVNQAQHLLLHAAKSLAGRGASTFDRYRALNTCHRFLEEIRRRRPGSDKVLAFHQKIDEPGFELGGKKYEYQMGKTHLLNELAWHSVLNGFLPCLLPRSLAHPPKPNLLLFALRLAEVMDDLRAAFQLSKRYASAAQRLAFRSAGVQKKFEELSPEEFRDTLSDVKQHLQQAVGIGAGGLEIAAIKEVIASDAAQLLSDVSEKCPMAQDVLVLIDDLHTYRSCFEMLLECVDDFGLGGPRASVPVIVTFSSKREAGLDVEKLFTNQARAIGRRSRCMSLEPLHDAEGRLAYSQYLLSIGFAQFRGISKELLTVRDSLVKRALQRINGAPGLFELTEDFSKIGEEVGLYVKAKDDDIFRQLAEQQALLAQPGVAHG